MDLRNCDRARPSVGLPLEREIARTRRSWLPALAATMAGAGGLTEGLIAELSQFRELRVMARSATKRFEGLAVDLKEFAANSTSRQRW